MIGLLVLIIEVVLAVEYAVWAERIFYSSRFGRYAFLLAFGPSFVGLIGIALIWLGWSYDWFYTLTFCHSVGWTVVLTIVSLVMLAVDLLYYLLADDD